MTREWDLLDSLPPRSTSEVLALASLRQVPEGEVLFRLGDEAKNLFLVSSGRVSLTFPLRIGSGQEEILAEERRPGQLVGWSGLIPPHRFTLHAAAAVESELLVLPGRALRDLFLVKPEIGYQVASNLARIVGQRLTIFQTMWIRELQRVVEKQGT
jgi:CRP/FNR family cyclic AMP-dependent transcriptional regulator